MGLFEFIVALVAINALVKLLRDKGKKARGKEFERLVGEIRALREEVAELRRQNNDVLLGLDTGMDRLERRVSRVESQAYLGAGEERPAEVAARLR